MGKKRQPLSQTEIWDDTALIRSWEDALAEYKLYHSINARGERVEDILQEELTRDDSISGNGLVSEAVPMDTNGVNHETLEDGELEDHIEAAMPTNLNNSEDTQPHHAQDPAETNTAGSTQGIHEMAPNIIGGSLGDEALKNLMMSWYWAGYYTGHYEGQQQALQRVEPDAPGNQPKDG
ncbi:hypothetical protein MMC24_004792 [Lignoscripta atroalba]|nr:hypothetical protein [Lignoscripta atroalba]